MAHETQGYLVYGDPTSATTPKLDRMLDNNNPLTVGNLLHGVAGSNPPDSLQVPLFNFGDSLYFTMDGQSILTYNAAGQVEDGTMAMAGNLVASDYIGVSQGGFSILFGLMPDTRTA